ncbi:hypothetical protein SFRURICE_005817 [Spodoptera frugiperda]|nr:hypothetical protein SFRURICE_005817 [Spodoptera frugiperda]
MARSVIYLFITIALCFVSQGATYKVPPAKLEAIYPKGLRVSVPDDGFSLFAFHGNLNVEMEGLEAGQWARDITKPKNGTWYFRDRNAELKLGDKIYFWTYVIKNGLGYRQDDGEWTVTGFVNEDGTPVDPSVSPTLAPVQTPTQPTAAPPTYRPPTTAPVQCQPSATTVAGRGAVCQGALIFNEEFSNSALKDLNSWSPEIRFPEEPDYPFNVYMPDNTISFEDGSLVITPVLTEAMHHEGFLVESLDLTNRCTGQLGTTECRRQASGAQILPPVTTGKITTRHRFGFKFGRIEVRAKLPEGSWLIPGLMRIAFARGNPSLAKKLCGGPILSDSDPFRSLLMKEKIGIDNWNKDFHNYTLIWRPNGLQLFVDGEQYGTIDPGDGFFNTARQHAVPHASNWLRGTVMAPLDETFYISLGLRAGGVHDFADDIPDKPWRNRGSKAMLDFWKHKASWHPSWYNANLKVDYIKVFAFLLPNGDMAGCTKIICILLFIALCDAQKFNIADPIAEALNPKGFRIILKDDGYSFVGFRVNINNDFSSGPSEGQFKKDMVRPKKGYWTYVNRDAKLNIGDTIYYWMFIKKNNEQDFFNDFSYTVTQFVNENSAPATPNSKDQLETRLDTLDPTCTVSKTIVQGKAHVCQGALIFNEDFDNANFVQWAPLIQIPGEPDFPFNAYIPDQTLSIQDGSLAITPVLTESMHEEDFIYHSTLDLDTRCTGKAQTSECRVEAVGAQILPPVITGKITTRYSFAFTFGRVEVRAKLPYGRWLLPEINLEPLDFAYGPNYESGLMRIAFVRGNPFFAKRLYGGPVLAHSEPFRSELLQQKLGTDNWYKDFHNYTLIWKPDGIELLVDNEKYGVVDPGAGFSEKAQKHNMDQFDWSWNRGTIMAPFDKLFYLTLGLRVGGINDFDDGVDNKPWGNKESKAMLNFWHAKETWFPSWSGSALKIDSVKVYAL